MKKHPCIRLAAPSTLRLSDPNEVLELGVIPSLTGQDSDSGIDRRPLYLRDQHASVSPESFQVQIIFQDNVSYLEYLEIHNFHLEDHLRLYYSCLVF